MSLNLLGLNRNQFETLCAGMGEKPFRARQMMRWMHQAGAGDFGLMTDVSNFVPPAIFSRASRVTLRMSARMRPAINLIISNVPGPPVPLYCAGRRMLGHFPVSVITDGAGLNITVMSYEDRIDFGIVADRDMVDDVWTLKDATESAMEELLTSILGQSPAELAT